MEEYYNFKVFDGVEMNRKIYCKECREDWGVIVFINGMEWMCIKIFGFVF